MPQCSTAVRNGALDSRETTIGTDAILEIRTGVQPANCAAASTGTLLALIFVGTDLALLDTTEVDLESLADKAAFGVRLTMKPAQPGVFIRLVTTLAPVLTTTDTILVSITLLGRNVH